MCQPTASDISARVDKADGPTEKRFWLSAIAATITLFTFWLLAERFPTLRTHEIAPDAVSVLPHEGEHPFRRRKIGEMVYDLNSARKLPLTTQRQYTYSFKRTASTPRVETLFVPFIGGEARVYMNGVQVAQTQVAEVIFPGQAPRYIAQDIPLTTYQTGLNRMIIVMRPDTPYAELPTLYFGAIDDIRQITARREIRVKGFRYCLILLGGAWLLLALWGVFRSPNRSTYVGVCIIGIAQLITGLLASPQLIGGIFGIVPVYIGICIIQLFALFWIFRVRSSARNGVDFGLFFVAVLATCLSLWLLLPASQPNFVTSIYPFILCGVWPFMILTLWRLGISDLKRSKIRNTELEARLAEQEALIARQEKAIQDALKAKGRLEERQRLTRDIHDGIGGQLLSLLVSVRDGDMSRADIESNLLEGLNDLRLIVDSMDHFESDLEGAFVTFRARANAQLKAADVALHWTQSDPFISTKIGHKRTLNIFRLMQEAITNIIRHADCDKVEITVGRESQGNDLTIVIADNGVGFDPSDLPEAGQGVKNMHYRAEEVGGTLTIFRRASGGTALRLIIPPSTLSSEADSTSN